MAERLDDAVEDPLHDLLHIHLGRARCPGNLPSHVFLGHVFPSTVTGGGLALVAAPYPAA
jgi:hypothetical protein